MDIDDLDFELEPDDHIYRIDGMTVPSCSHILELARNPILGMSWERLAMIERGELPEVRVPKQVLRSIAHARKRGNAVHRAVELHEKRDLDRRKLTREVSCRLDLWRFFKDEYKVRPVPILKLPKWWPDPSSNILCEIPLVHPDLMFGVTADCGLFEIQGELGVIEVKATSTNNDATALQLASQERTINYFFENSVGRVEARYGVRLDPRRRRAEVIRYRDRADFSTFLSFMNVSNWRSIHKVGETYA